MKPSSAWAGAWLLLLLPPLLFQIFYGPISPIQPIPSSYSFAGCASIVGILVFLSRKRAIGGWLLCYYLVLYFGFYMRMGTFHAFFPSLQPDGWDDPQRYVLFILSTVPVFALIMVEVYAATMLQWHRPYKKPNGLRRVLLALVVANVFGLVIDLLFFTGQDVSSVVSVWFLQNLMALVLNAIWLAYFYRSKRVRAVFGENEQGDRNRYRDRSLTKEDQRRLRRRALVSFGVVCVLFLIFYASLIIWGKRPIDQYAIQVPIFYGALAAMTAWCLPLRKRKPPVDETAQVLTGPNGKMGMNASQRKILARGLFVVGGLCAIFTAMVVADDPLNWTINLVQDYLVTTLLAPVAIISAFYIRAGGK